MSKVEYKTTREKLIQVSVPESTKTYKAISHEQLMDLTLNSIHKSGFDLDKEIYTASSNGQIATGRFTINNVNDRDMQLQIGWQNSYNKQVTLKFAIGARIYICQNGCVSGDHGSFKKKHVGEVQTFTPDAITDYIKSAADAFQRIQKERDAMKEIETNTRKKAELLGRMLIEDQFIESTQLNIIEKEIKHPTHDYGAKDSLWELYQYTTYAMKEINPRLWMDRHIDAHTFFVNEAGILVKSEEKVHPVRKQLNLFELV
jgi:hypothetical protein